MIGGEVVLDHGKSDWEEGQASSGGENDQDARDHQPQEHQRPPKRQRKRRGNNGDSFNGNQKKKHFPSLSQLDQMERNSLSRKALPLFDEGEDPRRLDDPDNCEGPPMSGFEYLRMVRTQALNCPDVMIADQLPPTLEPSQQPTAESLHQMKRWGIEETVAKNIQDSEQGDHLPSLQWHSEFIIEFKRLKRVSLA
jgi:hypothetical protein